MNEKMPKHHNTLSAVSAIALGLVAAQTQGIAAPSLKGSLMQVAQSGQPVSPDAQVTPDELEKLTNEVVRSLKGLDDKEDAASEGDLMDSLSTLVEKAMKEGKSSADVLQLIDEALQKHDGTTLQDLVARSGGKLDLQSLLDSIVRKAVEKAAREGTDKELTRTLEAESLGETKIVVVRPGDTLGTLAEKYLGNALKWHVIYEANKDRLKNPDIVPIGMRLRIPLEE